MGEVFVSKQAIFDDLEKFCHPAVTYPNLSYWEQIRRQLRAAWQGNHHLRSLINAIRLIIMVLAALLFTPLAALLYFLGFRFVSVDLTQVGSVAYLDLILRDNALRGRTNAGRLFVARTPSMEANSAALDLYDDKLTYLRSPLVKLLASPFFMNPFFQDNSFRFDTARTFHPIDEGRKVVAHEVQQAYRKQFGAPLVLLKDTDRYKAQQALSKLLPEGKKFIAVHVRDPGFYNDHERNTRNGNIWNYELAFKYLIDQGYVIVRMGDKSMVSIAEMVDRCGPSLVDYAHSDLRSPLADCCLVADCDFYIGLASGIWALAIVFEKPTVLVNFYSAATGLGYGPHDLTTFKTFHYRADDSLVPLEHQFRPPFSHNPPTRVLEEVGVYLRENDPEEILETVREFIERRGEKATSMQLRAKEMLLPANFAWGGAGNFSHTALRKYFPA
jgi:putative glycosyltransferase (TIGR04372 family)